MLMKKYNFQLSGYFYNIYSERQILFYSIGKFGVGLDVKQAILHMIVVQEKRQSPTHLLKTNAM